MLGTFVILYLFLGGCGAGVLLVVALWSLLFPRCAAGPSPERDRAFGAVRFWGYLVGLLMLGLAALCLLLDLGRPQLFWLLFVRPTGSLLSLGTFLLASTLALAALLLVGSAFRLPFAHGALRRAAEAALCALSAGVMVYTGLYMACLEAVPLWNNPALPVLFALSSLSSGLSVVLVALPFVSDAFRLDAQARVLHRVHGAVLLAEAAAWRRFWSWPGRTPSPGRGCRSFCPPRGWASGSSRAFWRPGWRCPSPRRRRRGSRGAPRRCFRSSCCASWAGSCFVFAWCSRRELAASATMRPVPANLRRAALPPRRPMSQGIPWPSSR